MYFIFKLSNIFQNNTVTKNIPLAQEKQLSEENLDSRKMLEHFSFILNKISQAEVRSVSPRLPCLHIVINVRLVKTFYNYKKKSGLYIIIIIILAERRR